MGTKSKDKKRQKKKKKHELDGIHIGEAAYGKGVFADRRFDKAEIVGHVHGNVIDDPDHGSDYCIDLGEAKTLEPAAPFRFLNHSCEPNSVLALCEVVDMDGNLIETQVIVETLRPIAPGEQITIDYAWPASGAIPCGCGSKRCRGWIVSEDEIGAVGRE